MDSDVWQQLIVLIILIMISAFFSAAETALTSFNKIRLKHMVQNGDKKAILINNLLNMPNKLLTTILIGNNIVNIGASVLATNLSLKLFRENGLLIATFITTVIVLIFGEITPKTIAVSHPEKISSIIAVPIKGIMLLLSPAVKLLTLLTSGIIKLFKMEKNQDPLITQEELQAIMEVGEQEGIIETHEMEMFHGVVELKDKLVKEIIKTPRVDISAIPITATYEEVKDLFKEKQFSRYPVYSGNIDSIVGILYAKDLFILTDEEKENFKVSDYMRGPEQTIFIPETKNAYSLFKDMKEKRVHIAVVIDEYGGTFGIITLEDILETIVGEIEDETDTFEEKLILEINEKEAIVNPNINIHYFNNKFGTEIPNGIIETIGGFVLKTLGRIPIAGEIMQWENLNFHITMNNNRITLIRITKEDWYDEKVGDDIKK